MIPLDKSHIFLLCRPDEATDLFMSMQYLRISPNVIPYNSVVNNCTTVLDVLQIFLKDSDVHLKGLLVWVDDWLISGFK